MVKIHQQHRSGKRRTPQGVLILLAMAASFGFGYMRGSQDMIVQHQIADMQPEETDEVAPIQQRKLLQPVQPAPQQQQQQQQQTPSVQMEPEPAASSSLNTFRAKKQAAMASKKDIVEDVSKQPVPAVPCNCAGTAVPANERSFKEIGVRFGTDKVAGYEHMPNCLKDPESCTRKGCANLRCRPWGHFYDTMYQSQVGKFSRDDAEPFQFLEIGFFQGRGFESYMEFLPQAEAHSMEISCIEHGPREEGKWPFDNFAAVNKKWYQTLLDQERLHCGDASDVDFLNKIWTEKMKRPGAPPLKVVVDDGAHIDEHMAQSVLFWFPRIEPGGVLVMEDIQPIPEANRFRTQFLPQLMADIHFCGDPKLPDAPCFPTIQPLLASIHCELHICVLTRNNEPAQELSLEQSKLPPGALDLKTCKSFQN